MTPAETTRAARASAPRILRDAPIPTWIGVGGRADALVEPATEDDLRRAVDEGAGQPVRILGDGANLIVDDGGVDGLVVATRLLDGIEWLDGARLRAQAGAGLPKLIVESVRRGLAGIEGLAGVPASLGGAIRMNAGGAFGEIAHCVASVRILTPAGDIRTLPRSEIPFAYRRSGIEGVILSADLQLAPADHAPLRERLKEVMAKKKASQPLAADSAGCAFKNPTVEGARRSAGRLIDDAGCKGLRIGGAEVSREHANFIITHRGATARDVLELMDAVAARVRERFGVTLEREVVVWKRGAPA